MDLIVEPVDEAFSDGAFVIFLRYERLQIPYILKVSDGVILLP